MCRGFPVPHDWRFRSALLSSRTVGFPESGWRRQLLSRRSFRNGGGFKCSSTYTLAPPRYPCRFAVRRRIHALPALCPGVSLRHSRCPPRVPLLRPTLLGRFALTDSCARPSSSRWLRSSLLRRVHAGCSEPLLHDGPSRHYLCDPCMGAWVRTPPRLSGALVRCFPLSIGLPLGSRGSARETFPQRSSTRGAYFEAATIPLCSGSHACLAHRLLRPSGPRSLRPPGRIHRASPLPLPVRGSGIATCPNRTTDKAGLLRNPRSHPPDRSLVGCS